jgi:hypothetical protein
MSFSSEEQEAAQILSLAASPVGAEAMSAVAMATALFDRARKHVHEVEETKKSVSNQDGQKESIDRRPAQVSKDDRNDAITVRVHSPTKIQAQANLEQPKLEKNENSSNVVDDDDDDDDDLLSNALSALSKTKALANIQNDQFDQDDDDDDENDDDDDDNDARNNEVEVYADGRPLPDDWVDWSRARKIAWRSRFSNPNQYYFRLLEPGDVPRSGEWTALEEKHFIDMIVERKQTSAIGQWGLFSRFIPGRVGYSCRQRYVKLYREGRIPHDDPDVLVGRTKKERKDGGSKKASMSKSNDALSSAPATHSNIVGKSSSSSSSLSSLSSSSSSSRKRRRPDTYSGGGDSSAKKSSSSSGRGGRRRRGGAANTGKRRRRGAGKRKKSKRASTADGDDDDDDSNADMGGERYCWCRGPTSGSMIACEHPDCPIEWYHMPCVDLDEAPSGDWICAFCVKHESNDDDTSESDAESAPPPALPGVPLNVRFEKSEPPTFIDFLRLANHGLQSVPIVHNANASRSATTMTTTATAARGTEAMLDDPFVARRLHESDSDVDAEDSETEDEHSDLDPSN